MSLSSLHLEAFLALAQTRSFTHAAAKIHVTQSALSQRILNLESELQTTLFIRDRAGIQLTAVATELLRYCQTKESLEQDFLDKIKAKAPGELNGVIRIAGFSSVTSSCLLPALMELLTTHPHLQLQALSRETPEIFDLLKKSEVDFAVLTEKLDRDELEVVELGFEQNVLVESRDYKGPAHLFLDHDESDAVTVRYLKLAGKKTTGLRRRYVDDVHGILAGVKLGIGRAVLPLHLVSGDEGLRVIDAKVILKVPVVLHYFRQPYYSALHTEVVKMLTTNARRALKSKAN